MSYVGSRRPGCRRQCDALARSRDLSSDRGRRSDRCGLVFLLHSGFFYRVFDAGDLKNSWGGLHGPGGALGEPRPSRRRAVRWGCVDHRSGPELADECQVSSKPWAIMGRTQVRRRMLPRCGGSTASTPAGSAL